MSAQFKFKAKLWRYSGKAAWHFATLPKATARDLRAITAGMRNAFGSLRVIAAVGNTEWRTSVFADTKTDSFLLPVKADVRKRERISDGDTVSVTLEVEL